MKSIVYVVTLFGILFTAGTGYAQDKVSDNVTGASGFVVMPIIITEPAFGGFGGGLAPVYISNSKPVAKDRVEYPMPPSITAIGSIYTLNDARAIMGSHAGNIRSTASAIKSAAAMPTSAWGTISATMSSIST